MNSGLPGPGARLLSRPIIGLVTLLLTVAGCATTGDPNADTIFWSKKKAEARRAALESAVAAENEKQTALETERDALRRSEKDLLEQRDRLQLAHAMLRLEIRKLEDLLREPGKNNDAELRALRATLIRLQGETEAVKGLQAESLRANATKMAQLEREITQATAKAGALVGPGAH